MFTSPTPLLNAHVQYAQLLAAQTPHYQHFNFYTYGLPPPSLQPGPTGPAFCWASTQELPVTAAAVYPAAPVPAFALQQERFSAVNLASPATIPKTAAAELTPFSGATSLVPAAISAKKGTEERQYDLPTFRSMLCAVLRGTAGCHRAAADAGFSTAESSLKRYARDIRNLVSLQRSSPAETLQAQLAYVETLEFKEKGNEDFRLRRMFDREKNPQNDRKQYTVTMTFHIPKISRLS